MKLVILLCVFVISYLLLSKLKKDKKIILSLLISIVLTFIGNYAYEIFNTEILKRNKEISFDYFQPGITEANILQTEGNNCEIDREDELVFMTYDDVTFEGTEGSVLYSFFGDYGLIAVHYDTKLNSITELEEIKSDLTKKLSEKYGIFVTSEDGNMLYWRTEDNHIITLSHDEKYSNVSVAWFSVTFWTYKIEYNDLIKEE